MRIGVVTESSTCTRNPEIVAALQGRGHQIINIGMNGADDPVVLNYLHIAIMASTALHLKVVDFIVGGCGTSQGFSIACNQFPGVFCGHLMDPLDAWLFSQINNGNAISLSLNKGCGLGAEVNMSLIFDALFALEGGGGYPESRRQVQKEALEGLKKLSNCAHRPFSDIIEALDTALLRQCMTNHVFSDLVRDASEDSQTRRVLLSLL